MVQPLLAGIVAALTGFSSSFAIVLAGVVAVGATDAQAASGLLAVCVLQGVLCIALSIRYRVPMTFAWSTPGAALLAATATLPGGFDRAVGAFLVASVLLVLTGLWPALGRLVARIPRPIANAMLAGILFPLVLAPVHAAVEIPALALPVIVLWLLLVRLAPRWAVPAAIALAIVLLLVTDGGALRGASLVPAPQFVAPVFEIGAMVGIGLPLYVVTMAGQNIPGIAVLSSFGFDAHSRPGIVSTGVLSGISALFGGVPINFAALSAALTAGPEASPQPERRWIASVSAGASYLVLGVVAGAASALVSSASPLLIEAVAGLALLGVFVSAVQASVEDATLRLPAVSTLLVTASGSAIAGIGSAFWGLVVGLIVLAWLVPRASAQASPRRRRSGSVRASRPRNAR
ncbi:MULTISPECIES: benzoate/H(+) symporter BenE family transporter [unclassified Rathayibacter]|uniref:benzoate/H(+) symporter BenE family transporter n=1 Tax=unclassified Rathayibacter TaxID=2609250 RepID=UPI00188B25C0|nr:MULTISPECIES: benzoate/H(+) symporter BenE family transporter [unclassified Rathayibacter]MBF4462242.1 benzoate/H(+) symporter BenE family transporter [Rathayibacter sp. VKM Ac-2879]MBF4503715.1 benzoate/H(+) symporter BenE family transporter [Rathayibacter sp. VKM Ac-2878]